MALRIGCCAPPGKAAGNKTGSWRVYMPIIDSETCTLCGNCVLICPETAIEEVEGYIVVDLDYCKGCGLCAEECPTEAISMELEEK